MARERKQKVTDEQIIEAVKTAQGFVYLAARKLDVSAKTIYRRAEKNEAIREAIDTPRELHLDMAEGVLLGKVKSGEAWAVKFFLQTMGRKRGYGEHQEVTHNLPPRFIEPTVVKGEKRKSDD